jgi:hypothetical protein
MSQRITALQVVFTEPIHEDDAQAFIDAIRLMRGVADVRPVETDVTAESAATTRRDNEWADRLFAVIHEQRRS